MAEDDEKITTEAEDVQEKEEEGETNELKLNPRPRSPRRRLLRRGRPKKVRSWRSPWTPLRPRLPRERGSPWTSLGSERARQPLLPRLGEGPRVPWEPPSAQPSQPAEVAAPPPTPREEYSLEDHMTLMLRHTRQMQEARRTAVRDKYRDWVS